MPGEGMDEHRLGLKTGERGIVFIVVEFILNTD